VTPRSRLPRHANNPESSCEVFRIILHYVLSGTDRAAFYQTKSIDTKCSGSCVISGTEFFVVSFSFSRLILEAFFYLVGQAIGTAATSSLLCQPRVIVKMIVEKQMECRLAGETEVL
jgi:hypothetical protein